MAKEQNGQFPVQLLARILKISFSWEINRVPARFVNTAVNTEFFPCTFVRVVTLEDLNVQRPIYEYRNCL